VSGAWRSLGPSLIRTPVDAGAVVVVVGMGNKIFNLGSPKLKGVEPPLVLVSVTCEADVTPGAKTYKS